MNNLTAVLTFIYVHFQAVPVLATIGAYGVAIVVLTIGIRLILSPLQQFQLTTQRRSMLEQRKLAPEVGELRKKYKKEPQKLQAEMTKLYAEHGINPLAGLVGCLPLVVQLPILTALYYVFQGFAKNAQGPAHFLFVPNLNDNPNHHLLVTLAGNIGIPDPSYLVFPLLAAATTYVQTKMLQMPPAPNLTDQEAQAQQMQKMMVWMSPLMICYFALNVPAALCLYWFIGNCVGIIQQYFGVGWGNLLPGRNKVDTPPAMGFKPRTTGAKGGPDIGPKATFGGPKGAADIGPKDLAGGPQNGSKNGSKNGPQNGAANGPQNGSKRQPQSGRRKKKKR
ncbi:MAG TPA: YidC/Oxa1 family membrane protein insertase [Terriglobales bacterium]|nr:YidC/Oxa1 family membrane protein insertase [Terriglobales bacterium]